MRMRPRRPMLWILLALAGASALLIGVASGAGASAFLTSLVGPAWWLMPIVMIFVMTLVMFLVMMPMMSHGRGGAEHHDMAEDPATIVAHRYAEGEISRQEYLQIKRD